MSTPHLSVAEFKGSYIHLLPELASLSDDAILAALNAAESALQREIPLFFEPTTITDVEMLELTGAENGLSFYLKRPPVYSLTSFKFVYNQQDIVTYDDLLDNIKLDNLSGQISILPTTFIMVWQKYFPFFAPQNYIPMGVETVYKSGLNWDDLSDLVKEEYKNAIGRRTTIEKLPFWALTPGVASESIGVDGLSQSHSGGANEVGALIKILKEQEAEWVAQVRRDYGLELVVILI